MEIVSDKYHITYLVDDLTVEEIIPLGFNVVHIPVPVLVSIRSSAEYIFFRRFNATLSIDKTHFVAIVKRVKIIFHDTAY